MSLRRLFKPESLPDLTGKIYIVTGGNTGIGLETVHLLAAKGAKVYVAGRSEEKCTKAIEDITAKIPEAKLEILQVDLMDFSSVIDAVEIFKTKETNLHCLINNAGVMGLDYKLTNDGYEQTIQTNYISHWLLTYLLLPILQSTSATEGKPGSARIINLTSASHIAYQIKEGVDLNDINLKKDAGTKTMMRYGVSKLCNILHAKELDRRYGTRKLDAEGVSEDGVIWTAAVHPGLVDTGMSRAHVSDMSGFFAGLTKIMMALNFDTPIDKSAYGSVYAACTPDLKSGSYMVPVAKEGQPAKSANDEELARKLWDWTEGEMKAKGLI